MSKQGDVNALVSHIDLDLSPSQNVELFRSLDSDDKLSIIEYVYGSDSLLFERKPHLTKKWVLAQYLKPGRFQKHKKVAGSSEGTMATELKARALRDLVLTEHFDEVILGNGLRRNMFYKGKRLDTPFLALLENGLTMLIDRKPDPEVVALAESHGVKVIVEDIETGVRFIKPSNAKTLLVFDLSGNAESRRVTLEAVNVLMQERKNLTVVATLSSLQFLGERPTTVRTRFEHSIGKAVDILVPPVRGFCFQMVKWHEDRGFKYHTRIPVR